ncbi:hypothetical protein SteCoe_25577 [Stentor coeruleus]|uniref:Uncharacterized protein n=1 Tax=Stentor coeruleus TaxID=5963 RepID=A0A1R2BEW8_9CILI|nr:hypothetical protein SteCoe_25577 [Stentor coeruleus]
MDSSRSEKNLIRKKSKKIEDDLFTRHKDVRRKIDALKTKKINEQLKNSRATPLINTLSKRLASKTQREKQSIYSPTRLQRTHEILKNSRFMPKKIRLSLGNLKQIADTCNTTPMKICRYDVAMTAPRPESPVTFPSLQMPISARDSHLSNDLPPDITQRNEVLYSLRNESLSRDPEKKPIEASYGNLSIAERTSLWLQRKDDKIKLLQAKKATKATSGCTFRPQLSQTFRHSNKSTQRSLSSHSSFSAINIKKPPYRTISVTSFAHSDKAQSISNKSSILNHTTKIHRNASLSALGTYSYSAICPVDISLSYSSGYSKDFKKRAKPLIDYKSLNFNVR